MTYIFIHSDIVLTISNLMYILIRFIFLFSLYPICYLRYTFLLPSFQLIAHFILHSILSLLLAFNFFVYSSL